MLADTGYWLALANPRDSWHRAAVEATRQLSDTLVVTWPVITETCHLLGRYGGPYAQTDFVSLLCSNVEICSQSIGHLPRINEMLAKYRDLPMDLADASLVVAAAELDDGRILSTEERDFGIYRWGASKPFDNLLPSYQLPR